MLFHARSTIITRAYEAGGDIGASFVGRWLANSLAFPTDKRRIILETSNDRTKFDDTVSLVRCCLAFRISSASAFSSSFLNKRKIWSETLFLWANDSSMKMSRRIYTISDGLAFLISVALARFNPSLPLLEQKKKSLWSEICWFTVLWTANGNSMKCFLDIYYFSAGKLCLVGV